MNNKKESKSVMSYIHFNTTEEFEDWQQLEVRQIQSVSPAPAKFVAIGEENRNTASASVHFGVFVLYWKTEK